MAGEHVLVVEDNEKSMKLFRDVLQATGYSTLEARTGEDAVALARLQAPAIVLMDIQLPGIDGVEALARLRADERTAPRFPCARSDRAGDAGRPRAVPGGRLCRLSREAGRSRRVTPDGRGALRRGTQALRFIPKGPWKANARVRSTPRRRRLSSSSSGICPRMRFEVRAREREQLHGGPGDDRGGSLSRCQEERDLAERVARAEHHRCRAAGPDDLGFAFFDQVDGDCFRIRRR